MNVCIFCLFHRDRDLPTCTYGMRHEYPEQPTVKQAPKKDRQLCLRCGLHPRNPAYAASGCEHKHEG